MDRKDAIEIFTSAVASVHPSTLLPLYITVEEKQIKIGEQVIPISSYTNIYVIGSGKAAAAMAVTTEQILGDYIRDGIVVTKYHHSLPCKRIRIMEAAHPVPDQKSVEAVQLTMDLLGQVKKDDIVICLISGGASALWCDLPEGIRLKEMQFTFTALLHSGAAIDEMNIVRKHLSVLKGGQLVKHCHGATVFSLIISDVPGDYINVIASGPSIGDPSTFKDAYQILEKYDVLPSLPAAILEQLRNGMQGKIAETPKPGDMLFEKTHNIIIGSNAIAINEAAEKAGLLGYHVQIRSQVTGDAAQAAMEFMEAVRRYSGPTPACILQGGETTVKVTGTGLGGRNQHFILCALRELQKSDSKNTLILSGGTDGTDGPTDAAGAIADDEVLIRAEENGLSISEYMENNDAYHFFSATGSLLITGPTQTNVMDIMMAIVK